MIDNIYYPQFNAIPKVEDVWNIRAFNRICDAAEMFGGVVTPTKVVLNNMEYNYIGTAVPRGYGI